MATTTAATLAAWVGLKSDIADYAHEALGYGHASAEAESILSCLGDVLQAQPDHAWPLFGRLVALLGPSQRASVLMVELARLLADLEYERA